MQSIIVLINVGVGEKIIMIKNGIEYKWIDSRELENNKATIVNMYKDCFITYHYPNLKLEDSFFEEKIDGLKNYLDQDQGYLMGIYDNKKIIGYCWIYYTLFIDKKRCHVRSCYIDSKYRNMGIHNVIHSLIYNKALKDGCYDIVTMYASFNEPVAKSLKKNGFDITRIECVKKIDKELYDEDGKLIVK